MHWLLDAHFGEGFCRVENENVQQALNVAWQNRPELRQGPQAEDWLEAPAIKDHVRLPAGLRAAGSCFEVSRKLIPCPGRNFS